MGHEQQPVQRGEVKVWLDIQQTSVHLQESTCQQLQHCMQHGAEELLQKLFNDYLLLRLDTRNRASSKGKARGGAPNGPAANLPVQPGPYMQNLLPPVVPCQGGGLMLLCTISL